MSKPFWQRDFPLVFQCENCGEYGIMRKPEPWWEHICGVKPGMSIREIRELPTGKWKFIAEGAEARKLISELTKNGVIQN